MTKNVGSNSWLVSGWNEKTPDASAAGYVASTATSDMPTTAQRAERARFVNIFKSLTQDVNPLAMQQPDVQAVVDAIKAKWANAPSVVVDSMQDPAVPESARKADAKQRSMGAKGIPEGFLYDDKVYLVADARRSPNDVARVLMHEAGRGGVLEHEKGQRTSKSFGAAITPPA